ncbi:MAG: hypothetical protein LBS95_00185, partial [Mycoplasmataceae bacterium]|nr:hypothetical protein [Mycoplasmataceae bacterium]
MKRIKGKFETVEDNKNLDGKIFFALVPVNKRKPNSGKGGSNKKPTFQRTVLEFIKEQKEFKV